MVKKLVFEQVLIKNPHKKINRGYLISLRVIKNLRVKNIFFSKNIKKHIFCESQFFQLKTKFQDVSPNYFHQ